MRACWVAMIACVVAAHGPARADDTSRQAAADALFEAGLKLRNRREFPAACDRFKRSQALDPARGTLYNIGLCLEAQRLLASALATYQQLLDLAEAARDSERIEAARARLEALRPRVPTLELALSERQAPGTVRLFLDGEPLRNELLGFPSPVNPGVHRVEARSRGRVWTTRVKVGEGQRRRVVVPELRAFTTAQRASGPTLPLPPRVEISVTAGSSLVQGEAGGPALGIDAAWIRRPGIPVDVGLSVHYTNLLWTFGGLSSTSHLVSAHATVGFKQQLGPRWRLRARAGLGWLGVSNVETEGNPLVAPGFDGEGTVSFLQVRLALGADVRLGTSTFLRLEPLAAWYSPSRRGLNRALGGLVGSEALIGIAREF